jgi:hypothetical protein
LGNLPVDNVNTGLELQVLEPIWTLKLETANRVRGRIEAVLNWATARGHRQGENPAPRRGHLENLLPNRPATKLVWRRVPARVPCTLASPIHHGMSAFAVAIGGEADMSLCAAHVCF